jgi:hypothetical protein
LLRSNHQTIMFGGLIAEWHRPTETISELHNVPVYLPESYIKGTTLLPAVFIIAFALTVLHFHFFANERHSPNERNLNSF